MDATEVLLNTLEPNVGGVAGIQYTKKGGRLPTGPPTSRFLQQMLYGFVDLRVLE